MAFCWLTRLFSVGVEKDSLNTRTYDLKFRKTCNDYLQSFRTIGSYLPKSTLPLILRILQDASLLSTATSSYGDVRQVYGAGLQDKCWIWLHLPMSEKNRQLVTDEHIRLSLRNKSVEAGDFRRVTDHLRGIYRVHLKWVKQNWKMSTCNRLDLESLRSWPTMSKNLLGTGTYHIADIIGIVTGPIDVDLGQICLRLGGGSGCGVGSTARGECPEVAPLPNCSHINRLSPSASAQHIASRRRVILIRSARC